VLSHQAVDGLVKEVRMSDMAGVLLDHVEKLSPQTG